MTIGEVIKKYPKVLSIFNDYGLHCLGCVVSLEETIEDAAKFHKIDLKKFLKDLNNATS
ncbi:MAG: disulfide oxidoreductase [Candidatus Staskawiczbacteria bacterium CG10_big_fil_rev_8_21_14_0_10_38_10]|uniref:Disulfide oxidoreductase n=1 Tax=Candidatus Staskawiczbacteria bacterium CG10_big_fil_rev_8_21_14_0_10_38_10 TaxID=1974891 RepID=A0A2H9T196_9BACT|nr:MAG: disulfide oxidoreductase [Candidatus Staskawiczbacteria bacterium CG10_big_fil_rev_8_21_14_0_10_38_10]